MLVNKIFYLLTECLPRLCKKTVLFQAKYGRVLTYTTHVYMSQTLPHIAQHRWKKHKPVSNEVYFPMQCSFDNWQKVMFLIVY